MYYHRNFLILMLVFLLSLPTFGMDETLLNPEKTEDASPLTISMEINGTLPNLKDVEEISVFTVPSEQETSTFLESNNLNLFTAHYQNYGEQKVCFGLSIDGGGIRGLMPALWLDHLANYLEKSEDNIDVPLFKVFDYIGGTSIGGILSLGVAANIDTETLVQLFNDQAQRERVFSTTGRAYVKLIDCCNLFIHRYSSNSLIELLKERFENKTLQDLGTNVLITACTTNGHPWIFKKGERGQEDYKLWEVARCTSAAPTYFSAYAPTLTKYPGSHPSLIDGGLWVNNPSTLVAASIVQECQNGHFNPEKLYMLSLGTGEAVHKGISNSSGKLEAGQFINCLMSSHSRGNHMIMSQLLGDRYYRVNAFLDQSIELDDIRQESINALCEGANNPGNLQVIKEYVEKTSGIIRKKLEQDGM